MLNLMDCQFRPMKGKTGVIAGIARPIRGGGDDSEDHEIVSVRQIYLLYSVSQLCCTGSMLSSNFSLPADYACNTISSDLDG